MRKNAVNQLIIIFSITLLDSKEIIKHFE